VYLSQRPTRTRSHGLLAQSGGLIMYGEDTVAQRLLQVVRVIVTHEIDIVTESDWFEEYVEAMVDKRIKEMTKEDEAS